VRLDRKYGRACQIGPDRIAEGGYEMVREAGDWGDPRKLGDLGIYGWRGKIGMIKPLSYRADVTKVEFDQLKPVGTDMIYECLYLGEKLTEEALIKMGTDVLIAAQKLKDRGADCLVYACTSGTFVKGIEHERKLVQQLVETTGLPSLTMVGAVIAALEVFKAKRVVLVTPYPEDINQLEIKFFADNGIETMSHISEPYWKGVSEISDAPPGYFYRLAKKVSHEGADAILLSCGNIRTIEIIDIMETDFGLPVVSSNQATIWQCLRTMGINEKIKGHGRLLAEY
jgi:maleate isomerase